jgi:hypothetical protein
MSINNNEQRVTPYPQKEELSADKLKTWLMKFVKGELEEMQSGFGEVIDADIKYMMSNVQIIKRS